MSIREDNILIARYITDEPEVLEHDLKKAGTAESMHYHDSWDSLMPVVKKIELTGDTIFCMGYDRQIGFNSIVSTEQKVYFADYKQHELTIEDVYETVVVFIKWYNERT